MDETTTNPFSSSCLLHFPDEPYSICHQSWSEFAHEFTNGTYYHGRRADARIFLRLFVLRLRSWWPCFIFNPEQPLHQLLLLQLGLVGELSGGRRRWALEMLVAVAVATIGQFLALRIHRQLCQRVVTTCNSSTESRTFGWGGAKETATRIRYVLVYLAHWFYGLT